MIKYLGSKRILLPALGALAAACIKADGARTALDLFSGTTRVAGEFKRRGLEVTACDLASYSHILAQTYIATDVRAIDMAELTRIIAELDALPPVNEGYVTRVFCEEARFFHPKNGRRIDAIRTAIEERYAGHPLYPVLLTSLLLAADKVDSTTGQQMAYLKQYSKRAYNDLHLRIPELLSGAGHARQGDALVLAHELPPVDLAYLDPPYNQHRYFSYYHLWETLVRWDEPEHYGIACKRIDARDDERKSPFNSRRTMPEALRQVIAAVKARTVVVSYNNESWVSAADIAAWLHEAGHKETAIFDFDFKRYIGAKIGVYNLKGKKVGTAGRTHNIEHLIVAGEPATLTAIRRAMRECAPASSSRT